MPAIRELSRTARNTLQHPRTSQPFAKATIRQVFKELDLGTAYPKLSFAHFDNIIENAPLLLGGNDPRPLFLEHDEEDSPPILENKIIHLEAQIRRLGEIVQGAAERIERCSGLNLDSVL